MNVADPIRRHAQSRPEGMAVLRAGGRIATWREFDQAIDAQARRAAEAGLRAGDVAVVSMAGHPQPDRYAFLTLVLGLGRLGAASAAYSYPAGGARATLTPQEPALEEAPPLEPQAGGDALFRISPSSGTTGRPKQVAFSHAAMVRRVEERMRTLRTEGPLRLMILLGPDTHFWLRDALACLYSAGVLVLESLPALRPGEGPSWFVAPPPVLDHLVGQLRDGAYPLPGLEAVEVGGTHLPAPLADRVRRRLCRTVWCAYGATEAGRVARARYEELAGRPGAAGFLEPGAEAQAVDEQDRPLPAGATGVLRLRTPTCATGYLDDPDASRRSFRNGWFYPGDVGSVDADGMLRLSGRTDELINHGGNKLSPESIEEAALSVANVREAAAFQLEDALGRSELWLAIVRSGPVDPQALRTACQAMLGANAPAFVMELAQLPRNESGKVVRRELAELARRHRPPQPSPLPKTP